MWAFSGRKQRLLGQELRLHVPGAIIAGPGCLLGLELEFSVRSWRGDRVHFGSLIHRLALDGSTLDPGDPNAYRCSWGGVITCDGAEAEIATPPVRTRPGFASELRAWAETGKAELRGAVPHGIELEGYSAHFSAAMPAELNEPVCRLYAETFAADLMMLMDRADSPGLLVRPRPGRTELCGEFIEGDPLPAVAAFVAGTTRACAAAVRRRSALALLPPSLDVRLARAVHRYGWYVDRAAFGTDLHAASRQALLPRASGGTISAQSHLELAWMAARQALADDAAASDLRAADAMVAGSLPLPTEHSQPSDPVYRQPGDDVRFVPGDRSLRETPPRLYMRPRPGFTLRPVAATWDFTVFAASGPARRAYVCVPRDNLPGFVDRLEEGALDDAIAGYLALASRRRVLSAHRQTRRVDLYDRMGTPTGLLAPEHDPQTGRFESGQRWAKHTSARLGKRHRREDPAQPIRPRFARRAAVIGVVLAILLAGGGVAAAVLSNGHGSGKPPASVSFQPSALSFSNVAVNASATRFLAMTNNGSSLLTVTRIRVTGPGRHDFSVPTQDSSGPASRSGQAIQPAALRPPPCLRHLPPAGSCAIAVRFAPSAPGNHTAYLRIDLGSRRPPLVIVLTGTGIAVTLTPTALSAAPAGSPYTQQVTATGGTAPYRYSVTSGNLPPGLALDSRTGIISGTPTTAGNYPFTVAATDSSPAPITGSITYTLQILFVLTPTTLPPATVGVPGTCPAVPYSVQIIAVGGTPPYKYVLTGQQPNKMGLNPNTGVLSGTPAKAGSYSFTVTVTDSSPTPLQASQPYTLVENYCT
jgi:hypothetical protein